MSRSRTGPLSKSPPRSPDASLTHPLLPSACASVCYVPGHTDPPSTLVSNSTRHPRLTPNSVNVHDRLMQVLPGLFLTGYSEPLEPDSTAQIPLPVRGRAPAYLL